MDIYISDKGVAYPFHLLFNVQSSKIPKRIVLRSRPGMTPEEKGDLRDFICDMPDDDYNLSFEFSGQEYGLRLDGRPRVAQEHKTWIEFEIAFKEA